MMNEGVDAKNVQPTLPLLAAAASHAGTHLPAEHAEFSSHVSMTPPSAPRTLRKSAEHPPPLWVGASLAPRTASDPPPSTGLTVASPLPLPPSKRDASLLQARRAIDAAMRSPMRIGNDCGRNRTGVANSNDTDIMFSMRPDLAALLRASTVKIVNQLVYKVDWVELADALPDHGFPIGVTEVGAPHGAGGLTRVALSAVRTAQHADGKAWCAWIDMGIDMGIAQTSALYAPGLMQAGVDLNRLLVVRPPFASLLRTAIKVTGSGAFSVVVIDGAMVPGHHAEVWVRRLALLAERVQAVVLLLTDARRVQVWPTALRVEFERVSPGIAKVRVGKDRYGRIGQEYELPMVV